MNKKYKGLTPHNDALKNDIAKTVLMPGDPLRAKFIAEKYLSDVQQVNGVRGMYAFTGFYKEREITIMGSGMGIPSMGIYSSELFEFYDVDNIIRIGSTAALSHGIKLYDIIIGETAITESTYYKAVMGVDKKELKGSPKLINKVKESFNKLNFANKIFFGKISCSDAFYRREEITKTYKESIQKQNVIGIEMESIALYTNAERFNKQALTILSVSDHALTGEVTSAEERQTSFTEMMELALDVAINL